MRDKLRHETSDLDLDVDALTTALATVDEVEFAWLFGSRATGRARPNSDVDLAVGLRDGAALELLSDVHDRILAAIDRVVPTERVDLLGLDERAPVALRQQVFRNGRLLFAKDCTRLVRLRVLTAREWGDSEPKRREAWAITRQRLLDDTWSTQR